MKKYWIIFGLQFQDAFESRSRSFVWFLIALINPLILLLFWQGAITNSNVDSKVWNISSISTYYFLLIIGNAFLVAHIEEHVAQIDIQEGQLTNQLLKPFSYISLKFLLELTYRLIQSLFALAVFSLLVFIFGRFVMVSTNPQIILFALLLAILGFVLSFIFKMIIGITAFWFTDAWGFQQFIDVVMIIFAGHVMPIELFPERVASLATKLPFAYMVYYPVMAFTGKYNLSEMFVILSYQIVWIFILSCLYQILWRRGVKLFTGVGI